MPFDFDTPPGGGVDTFLSRTAGIIAFVVWLAVLIFMLYVGGRILRKAGYSGWLALLLLIPLVNIALIIWFAFAHWPVEHDAMIARSTPPPSYVAGGTRPPPPERPGGYPGGHPTPQH